MNEKEDLIKVGRYNPEFNDILGIKMEVLDIYRSKGLPAHMLKRKHYKGLKYIDYIPDMIANPDYIGVNPNEKDKTIEIIKCYKDNIILGIKLDSDGEYLYISTVYELQESKIARRIHSGRIKAFSVDIDENK